jgi:uncharacterized membrane protein (DUF4010 family)
MEPATDTAPYLDFAIALFLGALVGIEREKVRHEQRGGIGGIRTFILFAVAGAMAGWLSLQLQSPWVLGAGLVAVSALVVVGHVSHVRAAPDSIGLTTEIAALVVFLLGAASTTGHREIAVALGIVTSAVLAFRVAIHGVVSKVGEEDLFAVLKLLLASFVILPLLPDRPIDPWNAINPYRMWWLVVLISGMSLLGYVAVRVLGTKRGFAVTGLFGGLVSSTAVTLSFARRSREEAETTHLAGPLASGVLLAWSVMFVRVLVAVAVVHRPLLDTLWVPMTAMGAVALVLALVFLRHAGHGPTPDVPLRNPFSLTAAIQFALFFTAVLLVVQVAQEWAPAGGLYVIAALAGGSDVDAITLSMADYAKRGADASTTATVSIVIAAFSNTLVKTGMACTLGAPGLRKRVLVAALALVCAGSLALLLG